jgi:1,4-dihydroxy-2-naphthoate octaprenyltransferase
MNRALRGLWLEVRVIPVLLWSFSALTLGTALAAHDGHLHVWYYLGAVVLGVLIQGLLAHTVNEIEDWRSGTDGHPSPRIISGGSKVVVNGLLTPAGLWIVFGAAFALTTALGLLLVASRGLVVLPFGLVGVAGAIAYTMPPVRAAYRPFVGEGIAFTCLVVCVTGAYLLQGPSPDVVAGLAAVAVSAYAVSMLMVHHYLDHDADLESDPPKVTSIVRLGLHGGRIYAIGWAVVALAAATAAAVQQPELIPLAVAYLGGLVAHVRCRPDDVESVTRQELRIIALGIAGALVSAALLVTVLAWAAAAAVILIVLEMRLAVPPAEGAPA